MPGSALSVRGEASPVHFGWFRSQSIPHEVHRMPGKIDYQRTISKIFHGVKERDIRPFEIDTVAVLTGGNAEREIKKRPRATAMRPNLHRRRGSLRHPVARFHNGPGVGHEPGGQSPRQTVTMAGSRHDRRSLSIKRERRIEAGPGVGQ